MYYVRLLRLIGRDSYCYNNIIIVDNNNIYIFFFLIEREKRNVYNNIIIRTRAHPFVLKRISEVTKEKPSLL